MLRNLSGRLQGARRQRQWLSRNNRPNETCRLVSHNAHHASPRETPAFYLLAGAALNNFFGFRDEVT